MKPRIIIELDDGYTYTSTTYKRKEKYVRYIYIYHKNKPIGLIRVEVNGNPKLNTR